MTTEESKVIEVLESLNIGYTIYQHKPVFTVNEVNELGMEIPGQHCKNLFLRNKKGDKHYLVIVDDRKTVDLKALSLKLGITGMSFASPERLYKNLGLTPGSVSVFGLINNKEHCVEVVLDSDMANEEFIGFHPNINTSTVVISYDDFIKFIKWCGNSYLTIDIA